MEWLIGDLYVDILCSTDWQDVDDDVGDQVFFTVVITGKITVWDQVLVMVVIAGKITVWDQVLVMVVIAGRIIVWLQGNPIQDHEVGPFVIREWSPFGFDHKVIEMVYCLAG